MLKKSVGVTISLVTVERYGVVSGAYRDQATGYPPPPMLGRTSRLVGGESG